MSDSTVSIENIIRSSPIPMLVIDQDGVIQLWNSSAEQLFLLSSTEIVGRSVGSVLQDETKSDQFKKWLDRIVSGELVYENEGTEEIRLTNRYDEILHLRITATPILTKSDGQSDIMLIIDDVTQKALSREILERQVSDRTRKLSTLYDLLDLGNRTDDSDIFLERSLQKTIVATRSTGGSIHMLNAENTAFQLVAYSQIPDEFRSKILAVQNNENAIAALGEMFSNDSTGVSRYSSPILDKGGVKGILTVFSRSAKVARLYTPEDRTLLESIGSQVGLTLENIDLRTERHRMLVIEERNRLARALHDAITQSLYSLTLMTGAAQKQHLLGNLEMVGELIDRTQTVALDALKEMRRMIHDLRPSILATAGLDAAFRQRLESVESRSGIETRLLVNQSLDLPPLVEETLYYIGQEALNNALKHAAADKVEIEIIQNKKEIVLIATDNGIGFEPLDVVQRGGYGLTTMRERAESLGGQVVIDSGVDHMNQTSGTRITISIPLDGWVQ